VLGRFLWNRWALKKERWMKEHDPEVKAAVMAALLAGQGVNEAAREYSLPTSTVSRWRKIARLEAGQEEDVGTLLMGFLVAALETVTAQQLVFSDPEWVRKQKASDMAILHGVQVDKIVRLLEAMSKSPMEKKNA
jgi:transposase-like protein